MQRSHQFVKALLFLGAALFSVSAANAVPVTKLNCKAPYTVSAGDTLGEIALRAYGNSAKFRRIYTANKNALPLGPASIHIGQQLIIPCLEEGSGDNKEIEENKEVEREIQQPPEKTKTMAEPAAEAPAAKEPAPSNITPATKPQLRKLDLLTAGDYAPFTDPELPDGGLVTEILETAMKDSGMPYRLSWINDWAAHLNPLLAEKKFDIGFPWLDPGCPEADSPRCEFLFSKPLFEFLIVLFTRKEDPLKFEKDEDILGKTLCRPTGYFTHDLDNNNRNWLKDDKITLKQPKNVKDCFELLTQGQVDAVAINDFTGREFTAMLGLTDQVISLDLELSVEGLHALVHKTHPRATILINRINRALEELHTSGRYDEILDRHLLNHWKKVEFRK